MEHSNKCAVAHLLSLDERRCNRRRDRGLSRLNGELAMSKLRNPHPGEILKEEFLKEIGMSQNQLAHAIGVPPNRINAVIRGTRDITADTDLRQCKFLDLSVWYLLSL